MKRFLPDSLNIQNTSTEKNKEKGSRLPQALITVCFFTCYLVIGLSLLFKQPFGNPPDEYNRFLIPQYIARYGVLPNGYEESIRISGYGFSYAFQPILPYMAQGYAMRLAGLFTDSADALLYTARLVNLLFGLVMAVFVILLSHRWFSDRRTAWAFSFLVTFLPQSIFVHTYVNTDSCCMMSIAIILYGITRGLQDKFSLSSCAALSAGIILCALSYYNAYGYILSSILLFTAYFLSCPQRALPFRPSFAWKPFLKKGLSISLIVLLGIGWWFIRSAILYDGDFLGLQARAHCASLYAEPRFTPQYRVTWQSQGFSVWEMLTQSDFLRLSFLSLIGIYGAMSIPTSIWVYRFYKFFLWAGVILCVIIPSSKTVKTDEAVPGGKRRRLRIFYHLNMVFCMAMPLILSISYSYTTDYQPQGRYLLPMLIPLCYYVMRGFEKAVKLPFWPDAARQRCLTIGSFLLCSIIMAFLALTVYGYAFPYYEANPVAP